ncbi:MAG TPA: hypothetical protein VEL47_05925 [Myxococcota bacterium]|nr:hypothetical protein [Myxococcota bacterium]
MNYTAFTAIIFTIHHLSAILSVVFAIILSVLVYWLFIRRRRHQALAVAITFVVSLIIAAALADKLLIQQPFEIEVVSAGHQ